MITADSVESNWCRSELQYAVRIRKRVLALQKDDGVDALDILELTGLPPPIDFTDWDCGWPELHRQLTLIDAPDARIASLEEQRKAFARDARNAQGRKRERYERMAAEFETRIAEERRRQEHLGKDDLQETHSDQAGEYADGATALERPGSGAWIVSEPPPRFPNLFLDRIIETRRLEERLRDSSIRLLAIVGSAGIGKTAMICHVWTIREGKVIGFQQYVDTAQLQDVQGAR